MLRCRKPHGFAVVSTASASPKPSKTKKWTKLQEMMAKLQKTKIKKKKTKIRQKSRKKTRKRLLSILWCQMRTGMTMWAKWAKKTFPRLFYHQLWFTWWIKKITFRTKARFLFSKIQNSRNSRLQAFNT